MKKAQISTTESKGSYEMKDLKDKVVLVTGGSRGIGAAVAKAFADSGARIAITYRSNRNAAFKCAREIRQSNSECLVIKARVECLRDVKNAVKQLLETYGRIDILVNNAGIWKSGKIGRMTEPQWDETIDVNLKGTFLFCNEVAPLMKKQRSGKIINISSTAGQRGEPLHSHYAASKGGVIAFTKSIAVELAPYNVNVNSVSPGWVETDMTNHTLKNSSIRREIDNGIPRGKVASPADIAGSVLFLASDLAKHLVGATININGGSVLF
jgi:3-oxoacyl-[acyl-carrier protein] reductase